MSKEMHLSTALLVHVGPVYHDGRRAINKSDSRQIHHGKVGQAHGAKL